MVDIAGHTVWQWLLLVKSIGSVCGMSNNTRNYFLAKAEQQSQYRVLTSGDGTFKDDEGYRLGWLDGSRRPLHVVLCWHALRTHHRSGLQGLPR